ncbi:MAG: hypothetical protein AB1805_00870 [Nitrospirota bacterium]
MMEKTTPYAANYNSALSFLKLDQKEPAIETLKRALSQVPEADKSEDNATYLGILASLAFLSLEKRESRQAAAYVDEGLTVKKNHADLLFVRALLLVDAQRFDEVLETAVHYLLALQESDAPRYGYRYTHPGALKEVYDTLIPMACRYALQYDQIKDIVDKLWHSTKSEWIKRAHEAMEKAGAARNCQTN